MRELQTVAATPASSAVKSDSVERSLLFLCARLNLDDEARRTVANLLESPIDWDAFIGIANRHGVLPLVHRTLHQIGPGTVPATALTSMRRGTSAIAQRNLRLTAELLGILEVFDANEIPVIPYKGPVLATLVYGDLSLRQFGDLDVIVPRAQVGRALEILTAQGFKKATETDKDVGLVHQADGWRLELHWGVTTDTYPIQVPPDRLWQNLKTFVIAGRTVNTHATEDLLLFLCIHGSKHCWERLGWLCDVAEIVRGHPVDWNHLIEEATALGGRRILFLSLLLTQDLLGTALPHEVLSGIEADPALRPLAEEVRGWLSNSHTRNSMLGERERFFIRLREHRRDRFRVAFRQTRKNLTPNSRDRQALPLPLIFSPLLYPVRAVRLAHAHGLAPFSRFLKGLFRL